MIFKVPFYIKKELLALGGESEGVFAFFKNGLIFLSENFGDLLDESNFQKFKKSVLNYLKKEKTKPDIILTDLHPLYKTTIWARELAKNYKSKHIQVQHHISHIFSSIGEKLIENCKLKIGNCLGIACDGTGYGLDGKIWGGEIFKMSNVKCQMSNLNIERVGHLENQIMIGGEMAILEPGRMIISILDKFSVFNFQFSNKKEFIYYFIKEFYTKNQFEVLYNQLQQNFNCLETSSTGRILDAVSVLLGFCGNKRNYKHEPIRLLEDNSTTPYYIEPKIKKIRNVNQSIFNFQFSIFNKMSNVHYELETTPLFEYLIKNFHRDKKRLAATAQIYLAQGLYEIVKKIQNTEYKIQNTFFAGGIANNKIISNYLESKGIYTSKKIGRGDTGLSFGQVIYYLSNKTRPYEI